MREMTMTELYDLLNSKKFQDTEEGDLFYNFYIYQYPAEKEYEMRDQIVEFKKNLIRPTSYVDVLTIDIFEEFCNYLDQKEFLWYSSMLDFLRDEEQEDSANAASVQETLIAEAHSKEFLQFLEEVKAKTQKSISTAIICFILLALPIALILLRTFK